jgi:serine/threonine protein kinase
MNQNDRISIIVKSFFVPISVECCLIKRIIEKLANLRHPWIAAPIGFVHSSQCGALKIGRLYACSGSLSEVVQVSPEWWSPTTKAKAIARLVLGLRFGHSLGLVHRHLTANNILFNEDGVIHEQGVIGTVVRMRMSEAFSKKSRHRQSGRGSGIPTFVS